MVCSSFVIASSRLLLFHLPAASSARQSFGDCHSHAEVLSLLGSSSPLFLSPLPVPTMSTESKLRSDQAMVEKLLKVDGGSTFDRFRLVRRHLAAIEANILQLPNDSGDAVVRWALILDKLKNKYETRKSLTEFAPTRSRHAPSSSRITSHELNDYDRRTPAHRKHQPIEAPKRDYRRETSHHRPREFVSDRNDRQRSRSRSPDNSSKRCFYCGLRGHISHKCPEVASIKCYSCGEFGHQSFNCGKYCTVCSKFGHFTSNCWFQ